MAILLVEAILTPARVAGQARLGRRLWLLEVCSLNLCRGRDHPRKTRKNREKPSIVPRRGRGPRDKALQGYPNGAAEQGGLRSLISGGSTL
jgi:hypothetical protein